ncbi:unnamed protein product [Rotaria sordida]|uniref:Helicase ATP-binding domain-containing protein n=1 Tax=Rotaria sordida TaxID=392033 RepID=A0A818SW15_9BILA|nr:unnamed protein product [Rotaria sordida]
MNLREPLIRGVYDYDVERLAAVQQRAIKRCISDHDISVQAQSNTEKMKAIAIPTLQQLDVKVVDYKVLILTPTQESVQEIQKIVLALSHYVDVTCYACINGTNTRNDVKRLEADVQIVVGTPGCVYDMLKRSVPHGKNIKLLILNEAEKMLSHGFKNQISDIFTIISRNTQVILLSATMPSDVLEVTTKFTKNPIKILVKNKLTLEDIRQFYVFVERKHGDIDLIEPHVVMIKSRTGRSRTLNTTDSPTHITEIPQDDDEEISDDNTFDYDSYSDECKNEVVDIECFNSCFISRYNFCPMFFPGSLQDACQAAFTSKVIKEHRPVLVYIHHDRSIFSNIFCLNIFCSEIIIEYLLENYIVWPWDITFELNKNKLIQIWREVFSTEFLNISLAEQCPMLIGIMRRSARAKDWSLTSEYEVKILLNGDTLTCTQEKLTRETLLGELINLKEEFDENEQILVSL